MKTSRLLPIPTTAWASVSLTKVGNVVRPGHIRSGLTTAQSGSCRSLVAQKNQARQGAPEFQPSMLSPDRHIGAMTHRVGSVASGNQRSVCNVRVGMRRIGALGLAMVVLALLGGCDRTGDRQNANGPPKRAALKMPPYAAGAEAGETYDYVLYTHCGIMWTRIDGVWWETQPLDDGSGNPPPGWSNPFDAGRLKMLDDDTAIFSGGPDAKVRFKRTEIVEAPFTCM